MILAHQVVLVEDKDKAPVADGPQQLLGTNLQNIILLEDECTLDHSKDDEGVWRFLLDWSHSILHQPQRIIDPNPWY